MSCYNQAVADRLRVSSTIVMLSESVVRLLTEQNTNTLYLSFR